jgi:peptide/nickel transport system substrate-binding protein
VHRTRLGIAALSAVAALGLAACGSNEPTTDTSGGSPASGTAGGPAGTLVVDKSFDLKTLDPARLYEPTGLIIARAIYDTLLTFPAGDVTRTEPLIASDMQQSDDAKTYTFTIRDDAKFADGAPVTAKDVVFSLRRVKHVKGSPSFLLDGVSISSPDPKTVVLESETPNAAIPAIAANPALGIVQEKVVRANGGDDSPQAAKKDKAEKFLNTTSAGSGPYELERFSTTTQTSMKANAGYWGEAKPGYKRIIVRNVAAPEQKLNVQRGDSQLALDLSGDQVAGLEKTLQVQTTPSPNVVFLLANASPKVSAVTSKPEFREAMRKAIDYPRFVELGGRGATQAAGIIPSMFIGALDEGDAPEQDADAAKAAVEEGGLAGKAVKLEYPSDLTLNGLSFAPLAQRIQADLEAVGLKIELAPAPVATALESYRAGKEELGLWYWGPDYPDPADYLVFTPGQLVGLRANWQKGADPELEDLAKQAAATIGDERAPLYQDLQRKLNETSPFVPLMQPPSNLVAAKGVEGLTFNPTWTVDLAALRGGG